MKKVIFTIFIASFLLNGCSTKKDNFKNRSYHKLTSWYNTLFNAEDALKLYLEEKTKVYEESFFEILLVDPNHIKITEEDKENEITSFSGGSMNFSGRKNEEQQSSATGLDLVEEKAGKAIERHSMLIRGVEKNTLMARAYLLLGKARYYKGEYFPALEAFNYIKTSMPKTKHNEEAYLFTALAEIKVGDVYTSEEVLESMYKNSKLTKRMKKEVAKQYAQFKINKKEYEGAIAPLRRAVSLSKDKKEKARYYYIMGQLYSEMKMQKEAGESFAKVYKLRPGFNMEVKSQVAIAENFNKNINNYSNYKKHLLSVAKKGEYKSLKNELYYAVGEIAYREGKIDEAEQYLKMSFEEKVSDKEVRGRAYETYGNIKFDEENYIYASAYYDSAMIAIEATKGKHTEALKAKNASLKKLINRYYLVQKNDSLLNLAKMPEAQRETYYLTYIEELRKKDELKRYKEEREMAQFQINTQSKDFSNASTGSKFYFYSSSQKSSGESEFRRIWGEIKLGDNWRNGTRTQSQTILEEREEQLIGKSTEGDPRRYDLDFYLEKIPSEPKVLEVLRIERDTAELALGIGYYEQFKNFKLATKTLEHLVVTPPSSEDILLKAYFQLYKINNKEESGAEEKYKKILLEQYPTSRYAEYVLNPTKNNLTKGTVEANDFYTTTYNLYKEKNYNDVKQNTQQAFQKYPNDYLIPKFRLLDALAIGASENREAFRKALESLILTYEETEEAERAKLLLEKVNAIIEEQALPVEEVPQTEELKIEEQPLSTEEAPQAEELKIEEQLLSTEEAPQAEELEIEEQLLPAEEVPQTEELKIEEQPLSTEEAPQVEEL